MKQAPQGILSIGFSDSLRCGLLGRLLRCCGVVALVGVGVIVRMVGMGTALPPLMLIHHAHSKRCLSNVLEEVPRDGLGLLMVVVEPLGNFIPNGAPFPNG